MYNDDPMIELYREQERDLEHLIQERERTTRCDEQNSTEKEEE